MTLFIALFFTSIMFLQGLAPLQWCSPFVVQKRGVWLLWFFAAATTRHTMHASSSGARLWLDIVPSCPVSFFFFSLWSFVFLFTTFSLSPLSSYITQIHRESAPLSLARLHFPSQPPPSGGICAQRARSQSQAPSDKSRPMPAALLFT